MYDYAGKFHKNEAWKRLLEVEIGSRPRVEIERYKRNVQFWLINQYVIFCVAQCYFINWSFNQKQYCHGNREEETVSF